MFKEKIIKEFEVIKPSEETETAVLLKMEQEQEKQISVSPKKPAKKRWIAAVAAVLAVVIVSITVFNMPIFDGGDYIGQIGLEGDINSENSSNNNVSSEMVGDTGSKGESSSNNVAEISSDKTENDDIDEKVEFPNIKYKNGLPTNITHAQAYQLCKAIYYAENAHDRHTGGGTSSSLSANKGENSYSNSSTSNNYYTHTNVQVEGVDEGDVVKTDGKYIYFGESYGDVVNVTEVNNGKMNKASKIELKKYKTVSQNYDIREIYLYGNTLAIIAEDQNFYEYIDAVNDIRFICTITFIFDVSNPKSPKFIKEYRQTGDYSSSRLIGNNLYVFSSNNIDNWYFISNSDETYKSNIFWELPSIAEGKGQFKPINEKDLYVFDGEQNLEYFSAVVFDVNTRKIVDTKGIIGGGDNVYVNTNSIYAISGEVNYSTSTKDYSPKTHIIKFAINKGKITPLAKGSVKGTVRNQFSMDESGGYFRIITTTRRYDTVCGCGFVGSVGVDSNTVYVMDKNLKTVGSIKGIAKNEAVTSFRFIGNFGYFSTSTGVEPFFAVDFSNPQKPKYLASLEFPRALDYLHPFGENMLLGIGESQYNQGIKMVMLDISDPKNIKELFLFEPNVLYSKLDHKMVNILKDKNIIAFPSNSRYNLFSFNKESGFAEITETPLEAMTDEEGKEPWNTSKIRGIFIGNFLYVCNSYGIISYLPNSSNPQRIIAEYRF